MSFFESSVLPYSKKWGGINHEEDNEDTLDQAGWIAAAIVIFPLFLDVIDRDQLFCPQDFHISYSLAYLLLPSFSILLINITIIVRKIRLSVLPIRSMRVFIIKYKFVVVYSIITFFSSMGFSFIRGQYYACLKIGPEVEFTKWQASNNQNISYLNAFGNMEGISRTIGVCFITIPVMLLCSIVLFIRGWNESQEKNLIFHMYVRMRDRLSALILRQELKKLAAKQAAKRMELIIRSFRQVQVSSSMYEDEKIIEFIHKFLIYEYSIRLKSNSILENVATMEPVLKDFGYDEGIIANLASISDLIDIKTSNYEKNI